MKRFLEARAKAGSVEGVPTDERTYWWMTIGLAIGILVAGTGALVVYYFIHR